ncbi:hypothetical protein G3I59_16305 [Amycolatopsis rubida]|uniref:Uncharacterized protein n=1 Tax=Amycolatopsis rubida TaxID=112413 RepID=A0ABX0BUV8_9PSEU|nr:MULTISPECIES: hypothetical protein [Amycolatopsis]MYW92121.1 hypothetical protein [Amycolatopsis rubida]NEC57107.1 hypothetical protein [Amycolatopsis rubida]
MTAKPATYYDTFADPREYNNGDPRYPGSPMIALDTLRGHDRFPNMSRTEFLFKDNGAALQWQLDSPHRNGQV